ncbi:MAG TPA: methyltransferase domain-containing protein, partial [Chitinophagaceae bacterium]|nr:methyltransferase domain-containing protein [Chitinophagaceae bacterium]
KNRTNFFFYGKTCLAFLFLLVCLSGNAQKMQMVKGFCGLYYKSMDDLYRQRQVELDFYGFQPGQFVASIGAQCSHWEAAFAATTDSIHFYLEDIDTTHFNYKQTDFAWQYYDSLRGSPMSCTYTLTIGTEKTTLLPGNSFDKILIINSFHEFSYPDNMLADIKTKLKPGGILYIDETVPKRPGLLHGICKKPMLSHEEVISILNRNGYKYIDGIELNFRKKKPLRKIYAFVKMLSS